MEAGREGQVFTYANPSRLRIGVGDLVQIRLQGRPHTGLVVALLDRCPDALQGRSLEPVLGLVQPAAVDRRWRSLIEAVAGDCHTSAFRCLRSALPSGWLGQSRRPLPQGRPRPRIVIERLPPTDPPAGKPALTVRQQALLDHLAAHGGRLPLKDLTAAGFSGAVIGAAEARGHLRRLTLEAPSPGVPAGQGDDPARAQLVEREPPRPPTPAQAEAIAAINALPAAGSLLLWGVTGSGKTEVYLQSAASALQAGQSVLLLAPEIGLIPQLLDRCRARFGSRVINYHSGLSEAERVRGWRRCLESAASGDPLLAVGTRSAVFLPLSPLGLIILDEEHDGSYKQESPMPCYHARDVARRRAELEGARLVLGSATPSLETWLASRSDDGPTRMLRLPERIARRALPPVHVVDMRLELAEGNRRLISRALEERLRGLRERGEQGVVLVPRRGYRSFLNCRSCGETVLCPHCDVALTVHRRREGEEWLRCHWCDHRQSVEARCGHCGSSAFRAFGAGTQRVMETLEQALEGVRLLRFDADTTRGREGHRRVLDRFAAGEADVLVGTQMLAKGLDLPRITLAAVLAADGLLHRPDLRSAETCLQLLLQLAGRAGRGEQPGEVLVQTYAPEHPVIRHLVDGRYERFLEAEAAQRQRGGLVPFSRACLLRLAGPTASGTATAAAVLASLLVGPLQRSGWTLIGPAPAPVSRVAGRSRWQLLLHGPAGTPIPLPPGPELYGCLPRQVSLAIDPDPLQL